MEKLHLDLKNLPKNLLRFLSRRRFFGRIFYNFLQFFTIFYNFLQFCNSNDNFLQFCNYNTICKMIHFFTKKWMKNEKSVTDFFIPVPFFTFFFEVPSLFFSKYPKLSPTKRRKMQIPGILINKKGGRFQKKTLSLSRNTKNTHQQKGGRPQKQNPLSVLKWQKYSSTKRGKVKIPEKKPSLCLEIPKILINKKGEDSRKKTLSLSWNTKNTHQQKGGSWRFQKKKPSLCL